MMHGARPLRSTRRLQNMVGMRPKWWEITNKVDVGQPSMVSIYDEIGMFGVAAGEFLAELSGVNGDLDVHINSPGGDVFDAIAIYNTLKNRKGVISITVDGLAASAASFIAQAASPGHLEMAPFSRMMIHDGFAMGIGNAADMRDLANMLDDASDNIAAIYASRTGKPADYWRAKMRAETWYSDQAAVADGLADRVQGQVVPQNQWDLTVYNAKGARQLGDGWVQDPDGTCRFDPDGDGDDDSTPDGDTDHDYFDETGKQVKPIPPCPVKSGNGGKKAKSKKPKVRNADVDDSPWDADKAWANGAASDDPAAFYAGICAGKRDGDPKTQAGHALPYRYTPSSPPNAAGIRAALAALGGARGGVQGLTNRDEAQAKLEGLMKKVNPDYEPGNHIDSSLLITLLGDSLRGGK